MAGRAKLIASLGDIDPKNNGGFFVFERRNGPGHYVVWLSPEKNKQWRVKTAELPRYQINWEFAGISESTGVLLQAITPKISFETLSLTQRKITDLCSENPVVRARVYKDLVESKEIFDDEEVLKSAEFWQIFNPIIGINGSMKKLKKC